MADAKTFDPSDIILLLGSFVGVTNILELSENKDYEFLAPDLNTDPERKWRGMQPETEVKGPILCLSFSKLPYSSEGWVFGSHSATEVCDIRLAKDGTTGISKRHLVFDINSKTNDPMVTILTRGPSTTIIADNIASTFKRAESMDIRSAAIVDLGAITFRAWRPRLTGAEKRLYHKKAIQYSGNVVDSMPLYFPAIRDDPITITTNVRYGRDNAVYVKQRVNEGKGGFASVAMVRERLTGAIYGAKEPYYKATDHGGIRRNRIEELEKEYNNIIGLDHPHVVQAIDFVLAQDVKEPPWLIMEYIPHYLSPEDFGDDVNKTCKLLTQISSALAYLHGRNITHRDVKPMNILIQQQEPFIAKLADFGLAKHNNSKKMHSFVGTTAYMAPELFTRRPYTEKIDMFSLGIVAIQCLVQWNPFADKIWSYSSPPSSKEHMQWMRREVIPNLADAPESLRSLLKGLLRKDAKKRLSADQCIELLWRITTNGALAGANCSPRHSFHTQDTEVAPTEDADTEVGENTKSEAAFTQCEKEVTKPRDVTSTKKRPASVVLQGSPAKEPRQQALLASAVSTISDSSLLARVNASVSAYSVTTASVDEIKDDASDVTEVEKAGMSGYFEISDAFFDTEWAASNEGEDSA